MGKMYQYQYYLAQTNQSRSGNILKASVNDSQQQKWLQSLCFSVVWRLSTSDVFAFAFIFFKVYSIVSEPPTKCRLRLLVLYKWFLSISSNDCRFCVCVYDCVCVCVYIHILQSHCFDECRFHLCQSSNFRQRFQPA